MEEGVEEEKTPLSVDLDGIGIWQDHVLVLVAGAVDLWVGKAVNGSLPPFLLENAELWEFHEKNTTLFQLFLELCNNWKDLDRCLGRREME